MLLAQLLYKETTFRPGEDPYCQQLGVVTATCVFWWPAVAQSIVSAFLTLFLSNVVMVVCRGRSFLYRSKIFSGLPREDDLREKAFLQHVLGYWPMCWFEPERVMDALRHRWAKLRGHPTKLDLDHPFWWQPSYILFVFLFLLPLFAFVLLYTMFFYTSSVYMDKTTYSDRPGFEELLPVAIESAEASAAKADRWPTAERVVVPHLQRYFILLVFAWCLHFFLLEPLLLSVHLFCGEPSIDATITFVKTPLAATWRGFWYCVRCEWRHQPKQTEVQQVRPRPRPVVDPADEYIDQDSIDEHSEDSSTDDDECGVLPPGGLPGQAPDSPHAGPSPSAQDVAT